MIPMWNLIKKTLAVFLSLILVLFLGAGTLRWFAGWVFFGIFFIGGMGIVLWLIRANPSLLIERMTGLVNPQRKPWDKSLTLVLFILYAAWIIIMPLDSMRFHWSHMSIWLQAVGGAIFAFTYFPLFLIYRENSYLSPAARVQRDRGQQVISTGPYRYLRHPMYSISIVQFISGALLLGSWAGVIISILMTLVLARRAVLEEKMLQEELPGYDDYMSEVHYRMIPYLW